MRKPLDVRKVRPETLHSWLSGPSPPAVVDVRDSDRFGGHIKGSVNAPSVQFSKSVVNLREELADYERVVFHCQLSQQRGPKCASIYVQDIDDQQEVYVLEGGFNSWVSEYMDDPLTEKLVKSLYE